MTIVGIPKKGDKVYKEECVLCFRNAEESKVWCCVSCFEGFCVDHYHLHSVKLGKEHGTFLTIQKKKKIATEGEVKEVKILKLEVPSEKPIEFEYFHEIEGEGVNISQLSALIDASGCSSLNSGSVANGDSWSEPKAIVCEHALLLNQEPTSSEMSETCGQCEMKGNLWKCLCCGALSCGRRQFDGSGGNGHALEHFEATGHSLAVKLGTISVKADGLDADVYCYKCDDLVVDPELNSHLFVLGIDASNSRKTEKSTAELNLDINLTHSYSMMDSMGAELKELHGPWLRGFTNLGNSCYLASIMQSLRNLDPDSFLAKDHDYLTCPNSKASECFPCQLKKLYFGLSTEVSDTEMMPLRPWMFKCQAAGNSAEFKSGRQQDASEFFTHLLQNRYNRTPELMPHTRAFEIEIEETITCGTCSARVINCSKESALILATPENRESCDLVELLGKRFAPEAVEGWRCGECKTIGAGNQKQAAIVNLPKYLVIVVNRLKIKNWVPEKTECHVNGMESQEPLCLEAFCHAKSTSEAQSEKFQADPVLLGELISMGIEEATAIKALSSCKNSSVDAAMTVIFEGGLGEGGSSIDVEAVETLMSAGFSKSKAEAALKATEGDLERAFDWIFSHSEDVVTETIDQEIYSFASKFKLNSFITHKGSSVFCGHYVAHLKNDETGQWNLYNDEKVAEAVEDDSFPIKDAYIYIYKMI